MTTKFILQAGLSLMLGYCFSPMTSEAQDAPEISDSEIAHIGVVANQIDIDYADLAIEKSENEDIVNFARTMKRDHNAVIKQATELVTKLGVTPQNNDVSKSLLKDARKTQKALMRNNGNDFDKAYIDNEVAYHKAVISTLEKVLIPQASNEELEGFLKAILPALKTHLHHAETVQKQFH